MAGFLPDGGVEAVVIGPPRSCRRSSTRSSPRGAPLSLAEFDRRTGIPKPTAHRLIGELAEWDIVERTSTGTPAFGRRARASRPASTAVKQVPQAPPAGTS